MSIYELIKLRKSVRSYFEKDVEDEKLHRILTAAQLAPSARNLQEWRFIVVKEKETRNKLAEAAAGQNFVAEAAVVLVCCAETDKRLMRCGQPAFLIDVSIAVDHITLAAAEEGLGTCWIGAFDNDQVHKALEIPPEIEVVALLPLGYPKDRTPKQKSRMPLEQIVRYEKW